MNLRDRPIDDIDSLLRWANDGSAAPVSRRVPLASRHHRLPDRRRLLVCHDMRGGYLEDAFSQGSNCSSVYNLLYCQLVDMFIYFSHHLITIPPAQWINLCHMNGIPVLGTFITEDKSGMRLCNGTLFSDEEKAKEVAEAMAKLSRVYQFDGWLINIENPIDFLPADGQHISPMEVLSFVFLPTLRTALSRNGCTQLVWYDAVTCSGRLDWQNALNEQNETFFDVCDAIFLNYNWNLYDLSVSRENARQRPHDVYVGLDVFARKCIGEFRTHLAMRLAAKMDLSAALFAPGWVMECLGESKFLQNQTRFWSSIGTVAAEKPISHLPFATCFCTGRGKRFHAVSQGKRIPCSNDWSYLPMSTWIPLDDGIQVTEEDAFLGGSCIRLCKPVTRIAVLALHVNHVEVALATKSGRVAVALEYEETDGPDRFVLLTEQDALSAREMDDGWLWLKHSIHFELGEIKLKAAHAIVTAGGDNVQLGLFTLESAEQGDDVPLRPTIYKMQRRHHQVFVIVKLLQHVDCKVVNAFLCTETGYRFLAASVNEYVCLLFCDATDGDDPSSAVLTFSRWPHMMLNPTGNAFERLQASELFAGFGKLTPSCHFTDEEEQVFVEMFRSVG